MSFEIYEIELLNSIEKINSLKKYFEFARKEFSAFVFDSFLFKHPLQRKNITRILKEFEGLKIYFINKQHKIQSIHYHQVNCSVLDFFNSFKSFLNHENLSLDILKYSAETDELTLSKILNELDEELDFCQDNKLSVTGKLVQLDAESDHPLEVAVDLLLEDEPDLVIFR
jgi:hypothetical protein